MLLFLCLGALPRSAAALGPCDSCAFYPSPHLHCDGSVPYCCRLGPPTDAADSVRDLHPNYRPKDFSLIKWNGWYHVFYIRENVNDFVDTSTTRLGHDISRDLHKWYPLDPVLAVKPGTWDNAHVWAPQVIARPDSFYMFYAGVSTSGKESIGLAKSADLLHWYRRPSPIFSCENAPWTWCDTTSAYGLDFRDPFVMPDPDSLGHWLMYYSTRIGAGDGTTVPGLAVSTGDLTSWTDRGPLWTRNTHWWDNAAQFESPHLFGHNNKWFITYTSNSGEPLEFQTATHPADSSSWNNWDRITNLDCIDMSVFRIASEYFADPTVGGSGREYFCDVEGDHIEIRQMRWWSSDSTGFSLLTPANVVPPANVTDLTASLMGKTTAVLNWTAPGADSLTGTAQFYDLRYSSAPITDGNFASATRISTPDPSPPGTLECANVSGLSSCTPYYFALKTSDADSNSSATSFATGSTMCAGNTNYFCTYDDMMVQGDGGEGLSVENGVLDLAAVGAASTDLYAIKASLPSTPDTVKVRVSLAGGSTIKLDAAKLAVVSHPDTVQAYVADRTHVILGKPLAVAQIADSAAGSISPNVSSSGLPRTVVAGSIWDVTLAPSGFSSATGKALILEVGGGGVDDAGAGGGVQVQVPNSSGGWTTLEVLHPRLRLEACVVDSIPGNLIRLRFAHDYFVGNVRRISSPQQASLSWISPSSAVSSAAGGVVSALLAIDGTEATLAGAQSILLRYPLTAGSSQAPRQAFLLLRGRRVSPSGTAMIRARDEGAQPTSPSFELRPGFPNPFSTSTTIGFALPIAGTVSLEIYDATGRRVRTLLAGPMSAGFHTSVWDRRDDHGNLAGAGVYLCRIRAGEFRAESKVVALR